MNMYQSTLANKFHSCTFATRAETLDQARARFEQEAASSDMMSCAQEERASWIPELGEYPGDAAYIYQVCNIEADDYISRITDEYRQSIDQDTTGKVWLIHSGGNG